MADNEGLSVHAEGGRNSDNAKSAKEEVHDNQYVDQDVKDRMFLSIRGVQRAKNLSSL